LVTLAKGTTTKRDYMGKWTDDSTAIIRVQAKNKAWTVTDYGRVAPVEVWALESLLHTFRERIEWTRTSGRPNHSVNRTLTPLRGARAGYLGR
jgi:hypothetical protein